MCTDGHVMVPENHGNKAHWTKGTKAPIGYYVVSIRRHKLYVHRLIAETFLSNPENKKEVDHIDRDRSNNNVVNLRWATPSDNMKNTISNDRCFEKYGVHQYENMNAYKRKFLEVNYKNTHKQLFFSDKSRHWIPMKEALRLEQIHWSKRNWEEEKELLNLLSSQSNEMKTILD